MGRRFFSNAYPSNLFPLIEDVAIATGIFIEVILCEPVDTARAPSLHRIRQLQLFYCE